MTTSSEPDGAGDQARRGAGRRRASAETVVTSPWSKVSGSAPYFRTLARSCASSWVKLPVICAWPPGIGSLTDGRGDHDGRRARWRTGSAGRRGWRARVVASPNCVGALAGEVQVDRPTAEAWPCGRPAVASVDVGAEHVGRAEEVLLAAVLAVAGDQRLRRVVARPAGWSAQSSASRSACCQRRRQSSLRPVAVGAAGGVGRGVAVAPGSACRWAARRRARTGRRQSSAGRGPAATTCDVARAGGAGPAAVAADGLAVGSGAVGAVGVGRRRGVGGRRAGARRRSGAPAATTAAPAGSAARRSGRRAGRARPARPGHRDDDVVAGPGRDLGLGDAEAVDALADDLDRLVQRLVGRSRRPSGATRRSG